MGDTGLYYLATLWNEPYLRIEVLGGYLRVKVYFGLVSIFPGAPDGLS